MRGRTGITGTQSTARRVVAGLLIVAVAMLDAGWARAAPASDGAVQGPALPSIEDEPDTTLLPDIEAPATANADAASEAGTSEAGASEASTSEQPDEPAPEPPAPTLQEPERLNVAVGLSSELDGNKQERALLDMLEHSIATSPAPKANVRRLRVGAAAPREICREGRDDLVITIGYVPEFDEPVLLSYDCRIDMELGMRRSVAAEDSDLLGVLWAEHREAIANGARERRRARISPKLRTGLIAGSAVLVIGVAVGFLIAGAVRRETVTLVVSP